eukprot:TRINITY_DN18165_c0_g1_i1.p1 TRINITY_DN18165_c0_g1~~TRINITY_DN18165_c0_g1_i1.p1  ORF type:complete len:152 (+),score=3.96 TRINITY_DN18165_c0_g1_i1:126-581(+)
MEYLSPQAGFSFWNPPGTVPILGNRRPFVPPRRTFSPASSQLSRKPPARLDIFQLPDCFVVSVDLPGIKKDDVKLHIDDDFVLTISGKREPAFGEQVEFTRQERGYGDFQRSIKIPAYADPAQISAKMEDGVLTITIRFAQENKPAEIQIE